MPLYEYQCDKCKTVHELFMNLSDKDPQHCDNCGAKDSLKKIMSRTHFVLKGQGWYETDFKQKNNTKADKAQKKDASTTSTSPSKNNKPTPNKKTTKSTPAK